MVVKDRFLVRQWPDGCVVFDRQFGDTHALDPVVASIFIALQNGESNRMALIDKISSFDPDLADQGLNDRLDDVLVNLERLGLMRAAVN